jgi:CheY-like chemotaxis protein
MTGDDWVGPAHEPRAEGALVLVVDDEQDIATMTREALKDEGYTVVTAANGAEALAKARELRPAVILLDVRMPVMDGPEFLARYRAGPGPHAPVIAFAASQAGLDEARAAKVDALLAKPFELDDLHAALARLTG